MFSVWVDSADSFRLDSADLSEEFLFISGITITAIVERMARVARTIREASWARFLLMGLVF